MVPLLSFLAALAPAQSDKPKLVLNDGDRVVWLGGTLVEREQKYGYWETALHTTFPKVNFTLRNLGWSGDTVFGDSRAGFDTPKEGFKRLVDQTLALKPTVIFVSYGQNESFDGEAGLAKFEKGLEALLDALKPAKAKVILFDPLPFPNVIRRQDDLAKYWQVIHKVAKKRDCQVADMWGVMIMEYYWCTLAAPPFPSDDGTHFTDQGYRDTAIWLLSSLKLDHSISGE